MTSEPTTTFPLNIIQNSVKITCEKPRGLKSNLMNSYKTAPLNSAFYDSCPKQDKLFKKMLYSLTFFDVIVNERKNYGCIGWNVAYEFSLSDYTQSVRQLQTFLCDGKPTPFKTLRYIISECLYGGRIVDKYDKRLLTTLLSDIFNEQILNSSPYKIGSNDEYTLPLRFEHRLVVKFIEETIPDRSTCDIYGLHQNSDFNFKLNNSNALLTTMMTAMQFQAKQTLNESEILEKLRDINEKLPEPIDIDESDRFNFSYENSINMVVLTSEMHMFNQLLRTIRETCFELQQAIQGSNRVLFSFQLVGNF